MISWLDHRILSIDDAVLVDVRRGKCCQNSPRPKRHSTVASAMCLYICKCNQMCVIILYTSLYIYRFYRQFSPKKNCDTDFKCHFSQSLEPPAELRTVTCGTLASSQSLKQPKGCQLGRTKRVLSAPQEPEDGIAVHGHVFLIRPG